MEAHEPISLTLEEYRELAAALFEDAAALPPGPKKDEISKLAHGYQLLAEVKDGLAKKGDLDSH
jgi:hypothetical protein